MGSRSRAEVHSTPLSLSLSLLSGTTAPCFLENCETLQFWFASFVFCNDSTSKMWQTKMKIESGIVGKQRQVEE